MRSSFAVGVDVGGSKIAAGVVERDGRVMKETRRDTPGSGPFGVVDAIIEAIEEVVEGLHPSEIAGVGIGLPAQIDFHRQSVEFCTNLPLTGIDVRSLVMSRIKHAVTLDNDGHAAAIGEARFGVAKSTRDFVMITIGTGVGSGLFVDGRPYRGHRGLAGELGHTVVDLDGPDCPCGGKGHLEAFVAGPALVAKAREAAKTYAGSLLVEYAGGAVESITAATIVQAAKSGDECAIRILADAGHVLGRALVGLINLLNPQLIVIGGGLGEACSFMAERAKEIVSEEALAGRRDVQMVQTELGDDAGLMGAAALAFDEYDSRQGLHP